MTCRFKEEQHEYFNPRSPYGERPAQPTSSRALWVFQSTLPLRGATRQQAILAQNGEFQSTLPLRGATLFNKVQRLLQKISIHAPLTGSDLGFDMYGFCFCDFNPRSPYGERQEYPYTPPLNVPFQSTLPLRGATGVLGFLDISSVYFNPRSPYGERPSDCRWRRGRSHFNPRSPSGERLRLHRLDQD